MSPLEAMDRLRNAVDQLRSGDETPPAEVVQGWDDLVRITLHGWVDALDRDLRRATSGLATAEATAGAAPTEDHVAALEESLWRVAAATEKLDAIAALAFGGKPFVVVADKPAKLTMRPSSDRNKQALASIGTDEARAAIDARAALAGERSRLRRNQLTHSLAPIQALADLGVFIRVHHRDGRIFGYELLRWSPERWSEGIKALTPEALFAQRVKEARRGVEGVLRLVNAAAAVLEDDPVVRVPQYVYYDHDTGMQATERPSPTGPPKSYEVDFVIGETVPPARRRVSCTSLMRPGIEITFDDGIWLVIRVADGTNGAEQTAICRLIEDTD